MVNKIILVGRVGKQAEVKKFDGRELTSWSMATSENWTGKDGTKQERTQWFYCQRWGKPGGRIHEYLAKGVLVYAEGKMQSREYDDRDGNKKTAWEVNVSEIKLLGGGKARHTGRGEAGDEGQGADHGGGPDDGGPDDAGIGF